MSNTFNITPGRYDIPSIGFVDASKPVNDEKLFAIYQLSRKIFPWISLGHEALVFLRKQKLKAPQVAKLIQNAKTVEEVEILSQLSNTKTADRIVETKLNSIEYDAKK